MKILISVLILLTLFVSNQTCHAEDATGLGVCAGLVSGTGLSVRMMPEKGFGYNVGAFYIKTAEHEWGHFGLESLLILRRTNNSSIYVVGGIGYYTDISRDRLAIGAGFGYGWHVQQDIWLSLDLMLTSYNNQVLPYPQVAAHYIVW